MVLGNTFVTGYFCLAGVLLLFRFGLKASGIQLLVGGVHSYFLIDASQAAAAVQAKQATDDSSKPSSKKAAKKQLAKTLLEIKGITQNVQLQIMGPTTLRSLTHADDINALVVLGVSVLLYAFYVVMCAVMLGSVDVTTAVSIPLVLCVFTVSALWKADLAGQAGSWTAKFVLLVVLGGGALLSALALLWGPAVRLDMGRDDEVHDDALEAVPLLDFELTKAARGMDALLDGLLQRLNKRMKSPTPPEPFHTSPLMLAIGVSVWAGTMSVALMGPALRYARQLFNALNVPSWGEQYLSHSWLGIKTMQLGLLLPLVVVLVQVRPLLAYWGVPFWVIPYTTAGGLLLVAWVHKRALYHLAQAYLDGGLVEWYALLHNGREFEGKMNAVRVRLELLRSLLGRVVLQLVTPCLLAVSLALLVLLHCGALEELAVSTQGPRAEIFGKMGLPTPGLKIAASIRTGASGQGPVVPPVIPTLAEEQVVEDKVDLIGLTDDEVGPEVTAGVKAKAAAAGTCSSTGGSAQQCAAAAAGALLQGDAKDLWVFLGSYYGWWMCLTWCVYVYCAMLVYRLGLNTPA